MMISPGSIGLMSVLVAGRGDCRSGIPKLAAAFEEENKGPM
jgi:hypothetical protein